MHITSSYSAKIKDEYKCFYNTVSLYQLAVKKIIQVVNQEWSVLKDLDDLKAKMTIEHLIHTTKDNTAKYSFFDKEFYKFPSYLRRSAIADALGAVSSFKSLLELWEKSDKKTRKPHLNTNRNVMPVFYRDNMFKMMEDNKIKLKLFINNDWVWKEFRLSESDLKYITNRFDITTSSCPKLEKKGNKIRIRFSFTKKVEIRKETNTILAVDLGINNDAVCAIMRKDGTVIARKFINFAKEKDHLYRILEQISQAQSNGAVHTNKLWRFANNYNEAISIKTASLIVAFAKEHNVSVIVAEHLDSNKQKIKGSKKQRLHLWKKRDIIKRIEFLSHNNGLAFSTVNPRNTSKEAYDGSGEVKRNKDNFSICTFKNGKVYNTDLNASYNIGARYFIRNILRSLSEDERLLSEAKVSSLSKRTNCTLSTLISLNAVLCA